MNKRILLVMGGGIAAYKCLDLIRRLKERGHCVRVVMTEAARRFITPLSVEALAGSRVMTDLFDLAGERDIGHIKLSRDADVLVVAPATANLLARMAHGHADDLAAAVLLATDKPVLAAPAMNPRMWLHPATRRNMALLEADGVHIIGPAIGEMAEPDEAGPGRLVEVPELVERIEALLGTTAGLSTVPLPLVGRARVGGIPTSAVLESPPPNLPHKRGGTTLSEGLSPPAFREGGGTPSSQPLAGRHVLVTSGPTHEPIDPVRYIANRSSGKQGHALAAAAARLGARVTLVSGPVAIPDPPDVTTVHVETAAGMLDAVRSALPADIAVLAAAVADWRVAGVRQEKMKKTGASPPPSLALIENADILRNLAADRRGRPSLLIGFAAETGNVVEHAKAKLGAKGADWIVANDVRPETSIMGGDRNTVHLVTATSVESWPEMSKDEVATRLVERAAAALASSVAAAE